MICIRVCLYFGWMDVRVVSCVTFVCVCCVVFYVGVWSVRVGTGDVFDQWRCVCVCVGFSVMKDLIHTLCPPEAAG